MRIASAAVIWLSWCCYLVCQSSSYETGYSTGSQSYGNNYQNYNNQNNNYQNNNYQNYSGNQYNYGSSSRYQFRVGFSSEAESCPDFINQNFDAENVNLTPLDNKDEDGPELMCMNGTIDLSLEVVPGMQLTVNIDKLTDTGSDPMFTSSLDICSALKDEDALWTPLCRAIGIQSCPVHVGTYDVKSLVLDLSFADGILNHNYVGEYLVKVQIKDNTKYELISCHTLGVCVVEV